MKVLQIIVTSLFYLLFSSQLLIAQTEEFKTEYKGDNLMLLIGLENKMACIENITDPDDNTINYLGLKARNSLDQAGLYIGSNGYIVVGTDDPCDRVAYIPAVFNVDGDFYVEGEAYKENGNAFFTIISDKRLKKNINALEKQTSLAKLEAIKVYDFEYKDSGIKRYGVMAQEIKEILPRTVNAFEKSGSEFYNFNPNDLFYLHINATQELNNIVTKQEEEIAHLKEENKVIEERLITQEDKLNEAVQAFQDLESKYEALTQQMEALVHTLNILKDQSINTEQTIERTVNKTNQSRLGQNMPNPTSNKTTIAYYLSEEATNAYLTISSNTGQVIQQYPLTTKGEGKITIQLKDFQLKEGVYYYNLVVGGEMLDTKKMILVQ